MVLKLLLFLILHIAETYHEEQATEEEPSAIITIEPITIIIEEGDEPR